MYIVTVIPLTKSVQKDYLTYFTAENIGLGSIVSVPVRLKFIDALVVAIDDIRDVRGDIRGADFELKKVEKVKGQAPFDENFFQACELMKEYTASTTGQIIDVLLPQVLVNNIKDLEKLGTTLVKNDTGLKQEKLIFQALLPDRISWYRTLIREAFAKKQSVFICVPTRYDIEQFKNAFTKGIEQYVYAFHSELAKKNLLSSYNKCITEEHPVLIIGTGMFLSIPRHDIKTVIVEHESSDSYKQFVRPFVDVRTFAELLTSVNRTKLILGDTLLRPETLHRHEIGELGEVASPLFRLPEVERQLVIDMKEEINEKGQKSFAVLSDTVRKMLGYAIEHKESVFLFSVRKGLAPVTVCNDCGHTLLCPDCSTPVVLYGKKQRSANKDEGQRIFMCNKCGRKEATETRCPYCESWNLNPLGIGTDRINEEIRKIFPEANIIQIDKENTPTESEARKAIEIFYKTPGSILIGTEMAFSYLREHVTHSAIISLDGLLSIPSFNITQKILHIIEKLHYFTERNLIIQTRNSENLILKHILSGNVLPLYREDLVERKRFGYPPFKRLIKITFSGTARDTEKARGFLDQVLNEYDPQIFSAFVGRVRGEYITNTIIKIDPKIWPLIKEGGEKDIKLSEALSALPPQFAINVDPEDLL